MTLQETKLCDTIREKLSGPGSVSWSVAVLHTVIGTKTGLVYPSLDVVRTMQEEFGERLLIVVDACQLRCRLSMMQEYVDMGAFVLITGRPRLEGNTSHAVSDNYECPHSHSIKSHILKNIPEVILS